MNNESKSTKLPPKRLVLAVAILAVAIFHSLNPGRLALDWPTIVLIGLALLLVLAPELESVAPFIKKLKIAGTEIELQQRTSELALSVERSENTESSMVPGKNAAVPRELEDQFRHQLLDTTVESKILDLAARDKQSALMRLAIEIERELILLHGTLGLRNKFRSSGVREVIDQLYQQETISSEMRDGLNEFWQVRNRIAHAQFSFGETNPVLNSALDSGLRLLRLLKGIPRSVYKVLVTSVPLYRDITCRQRITEVDGVIIESISPEGARRNSIYPAGRPFEVGEIVGWDWDSSQGVDDAYYVNPESGKAQLAWSGAAYFAGKRAVL
jgi:hypothetical protein